MRPSTRFQRSWLDFVVAEENGKLVAKSIGGCYYAAIVINALLSAMPKPDPTRRSQRIALEGDVADPANPPSGCYFHPRCRYAQERCQTEMPALRTAAKGHEVACHRTEELNLRGV